MSQYTVTHSCGHAHTHQLYGKEAERQRKVAWFATVDCPDCYRAAKQATAAQAAADSAARLADLPLAALTGSDKQVAWATKIRVAKIDAVRAQLTKRLEATAPEGRAAAEATIDKILGGLAGQPAAAWWIDRREMSERDLTVLGGKLGGLA